jgi:hypothetical protein
MSSPTYFQDSNLGGVNLHFSQVYFRNVFKELEGKGWFGGLDNIFLKWEMGIQHRDAERFRGKMRIVVGGSEKGKKTEG